MEKDDDLNNIDLVITTLKGSNKKITVSIDITIEDLIEVINSDEDQGVDFKIIYKGRTFFNNSFKTIFIKCHIFC